MAERVNLFLDQAREIMMHELGQSAYVYRTPINPRLGENVRFWKDSPAHQGVFRYAQDIIIPDPRINPLPVFAPQDGEIIALMQAHDQYGDSEEYLGFLNYVTVQVGKREFFELCHIGKNSCPFELGDKVNKGSLIATTGVNGWMTDVRHIHFMVGRWKGNDRKSFESLKIRFENLSGGQ